MIKYPQKPAAIMTTGNLYLNYEKKKVSMKTRLPSRVCGKRFKNINNYYD